MYLETVMAVCLNNLHHRGLAFRAMLLSLVSFAFLGMAMPVAVFFGGDHAVSAAVAAFFACFVGAMLALILSHVFRGPRHALAALLLGMMARMGIPLGLGSSIHLHGGPLAEAGLLYYLIAFYLAILAVETVLSLPETQACAANVRPSQADTTHLATHNHVDQ